MRQKNNESCFRGIWDDLSLFEKKILFGIGQHVITANEKTKAYKLKLTEFGLDKLNPSDITNCLRRLQDKSVPMEIDEQLAYVPLLTDMRYDDLNKKVTITFNSILKEDYMALAHAK